MEDASLDRFVDAASTQSGDEDATDGVAEIQAEAAPDREPATSTAAWSADGATCGGCGETVERRWQTDDGFVCADCVDW